MLVVMSCSFFWLLLSSQYLKKKKMVAVNGSCPLVVLLHCPHS